MTWNFGDSFDLYAAAADAFNGYWDSGSNGGLTTGRFTGSRCWINNSVANNSVALAKSSGVNDAVHHIAVSFMQGFTISGTSLVTALQLLDGTTGQCAIVFRSDGAILLTSGTASGTTLATYTGAFPVINTWYAFEFEVVINNTTGSFKVRKNGNTSDDFSATSLNTRPTSTNNYANKLQLVGGPNAGVGAQQYDDLYWQSGASTGTWLGDIRCFSRMPSSDSSVQFSRVPTAGAQSPFTLSTAASISNGVARYTPFTAAFDGTIGTATVSLGTGYTGNLKATIFASSGSAPTSVLGSASVVTNPASGTNTLTFGTPVTVTKGTQYWIGFDSDTSSGTWNVASGGTSGLSSTTAYASFPVASPTTSTAAAVICSLTITTSNNATVVNEAQQDSATSYVYDSTVNDVDLYGIASISSTPASIIAVTTRAYMQKSDAGSRTAAVQLKSGSTTVASPTLTLTTSGWQWTWRTDLTDPDTSAAWTASGVNNVTIGPKVIS